MSAREGELAEARQALEALIATEPPPPLVAYARAALADALFADDRLEDADTEYAAASARLRPVERLSL